jgi:hypothetical protein
MFDQVEVLIIVTWTTMLTCVLPQTSRNAADTVHISIANWIPHGIPAFHPF